MGDPKGIGPEILIDLFSKRSLLPSAVYLLLGDAQILSPLRGKVWDSEEPPSRPGTYIVPVTSIPKRALSSKKGAKASLDYIEKGAQLALDRKVDAIVTGPVDKKGISRLGKRFTGHTEYLARRSKVEDPAMMFVGPSLKVSLVTVHLPLHQVSKCLNPKRIVKTAERTSEALKGYFAIQEPRLALAALNPHAGEEGLLGQEEREVLQPAMVQARRKRIHLEGPFPADTLFWRAAQGEFDAVIALYHDQGLIPAKLLDFDKTVNVTLGLPFIRTSVDHGVAYDIAGKGIASSESLRSAIQLAVRMAKTRKRTHK